MQIVPVIFEDHNLVRMRPLTWSIPVFELRCGMFNTRERLQLVTAGQDVGAGDQIGVMGSSAGGHLASLCATRFADTFEEEGKDKVDKQDCRHRRMYGKYQCARSKNEVGACSKDRAREHAEQYRRPTSRHKPDGHDRPDWFALYDRDRQ